MPFPYVTNQNLVHISKICSRYWETANHSAGLICAIKIASLDDEGVFSLVASKFKIFSLNTHQKKAISEVAKRGKDVFVNLPTGYGKSLIYQALPTAFDALRLSSGHIVVVVSPLISLLEETADNSTESSDEMPTEILDAIERV